MIANFIEDYNTKSEKKKWEYGVVHNAKSHVDREGTLVFEIDLGSAGMLFLKELLQHMNKMGYFEKVEVGLNH